MTYLPGDILTKVDRASMAHSLEVRVPFLDHVLVEWAATLPPRLRLNARGSKYVLKQRAWSVSACRHSAASRRWASRCRSPPGCAAPRWRRCERALAEPAFADAGLFDPAAVRRLIEQHRSGRSDHGRLIWALFMFAGFLTRVHGREAVAAGRRDGAGRGSRLRSPDPRAGAGGHERATG